MIQVVGVQIDISYCAEHSCVHVLLTLDSGAEHSLDWHPVTGFMFEEELEDLGFALRQDSQFLTRLAERSFQCWLAAQRQLQTTAQENIPPENLN